MTVYLPLKTKCLSVYSFQTAGPQWVAAVIAEPVTRDVELADGRLIHHHIDHIRFKMSQ